MSFVKNPLSGIISGKRHSERLKLNPDWGFCLTMTELMMTENAKFTGHFLSKTMFGKTARLAAGSPRKTIAEVRECLDLAIPGRRKTDGEETSPAMVLRRGSIMPPVKWLPA